MASIEDEGTDEAIEETVNEMAEACAAHVRKAARSDGKRLRISADSNEELRADVRAFLLAAG